MIVRAHREQALSRYQSLGLDVFPYDAEGHPFMSWPNPGLFDGWEHLLPWVEVFGVNLGSRYVAVDIDTDRGGDLMALEQRFGPLPPTMTVVSPGGERNLHLYFEVSQPLGTSKALTSTFPHVDFLGLGAHVKGATSARGDRAYNLQYPYLPPAPLPAELEQVWRGTVPVREAPPAKPKRRSGPLEQKQRDLVKRWVGRSLSIIRDSECERHVPLFRQASNIYQCADLLGKDMATYDDQIRTAYVESGGQDWADLDKQVKHTKLWAAANPKPPPAYSAYHRDKTAEIAAWADAAIAATAPKQKQLRKLVEAVAAEANTEFNMTTAAELIHKRYTGVGTYNKVLLSLDWLVERGFLVRTGENRTQVGFCVPTYQLDKT